MFGENESTGTSSSQMLRPRKSVGGNSGVLRVGSKLFCLLVRRVLRGDLNFEDTRRAIHRCAGMSLDRAAQWISRNLVAPLLCTLFIDEECGDFLKVRGFFSGIGCAWLLQRWRTRRIYASTYHQELIWALSWRMIRGGKDVALRSMEAISSDLGALLYVLRCGTCWNLDGFVKHHELELYEATRKIGSCHHMHMLAERLSIARTCANKLTPPLPIHCHWDAGFLSIHGATISMEKIAGVGRDINVGFYGALSQLFAHVGEDDLFDVLVDLSNDIALPSFFQEHPSCRKEVAFLVSSSAA